MMVSKPQDWIEEMANANVDQYTFHVEPVLDQVPDICRKIRESGMKVGLAIKPKTAVGHALTTTNFFIDLILFQVEIVEKFVDLADLILIMTVEPGFGGQKFMEDMMPKVKYIRENYPTMNIEVDGGVGLNTIECCANVIFNFQKNLGMP